MSHMMQTATQPREQQKKGALQLKETSISIIPITAATAAAAPSSSKSTHTKTSIVVEKATSSNPSMTDDDSADSLRKKRCTDRYDSSESSDSGVVTMSADSTATSDTSDPGSPFSHASVSTCTGEDLAAQKKLTLQPQQPPNGKTLKRQAQVTEKSDKKRIRKEVCSKSGNVEIKLIPLTASQAVSSSTQSKLAPLPATSSATAKRTSLVKSTLSAITNNLNVFKSQTKTATATASLPPSPIVLQNGTGGGGNHHQQQQQVAASGIGATISKLTDYYKFKKDFSSSSSIEKYCNMLLNLQQSGAKPASQTTITNSSSSSSKAKEVSIAAKSTIAGSTTITAINQKTPTAAPLMAKKTAKIAPVIPVARKSSTAQAHVAQQQPVKISPKKPVSIAPRIVEPATHPSKTAVIQPKSSVALKPNGKLSHIQPASVTPQDHHQQQQQPTVLLAAFRIPNQMQPSSQPPPLKIQNGLIQKTTTTMTTKLAPLLQIHAQPMIPNLIQLPNLIATKAPKVASTSQPTMTNTTATNTVQPNLIVNNTHQLTHQQQQQLFMNGAVIKLQPLPVSSQQQQQQQTVTSSTTVANLTSINGATQKFTIQQQQQAFTAQLAAQQMQQLFMTTPVLFNASSIPTVLTSHLAGLQHFNHHHHHHHHQSTVSAPPSTIPALQPIQSSLLSSSFSSSSMTSTTNSMQLPSFSTLLHNQQQLQSVQLPALMKNSAFAAAPPSLPPSLTITASGFMPSHQPQQQQQPQQKMNVSPQATVNPSQKVTAPPPLAPASNLPINIASLPKLVSVAPKSPKSPPPLVLNQKVSLPQGSPALKQEMPSNAICIVPPLPSPEKKSMTTTTTAMLKVEIETDEKITVTEASKSAISVVIEEKATIECAKSPILSQPKTIRFPPVNGKVTVWKKCVKISKTGVCNWEKCSKHFDSNADLLEHLHMDHINEQGGPFACSWRDCKVNGREGSKGWLERHVMSHVGSKPFKCIVERCGMRFSSQVQLEKHVNGHFNSSDQQSSSKRSSDPPAPKNRVKKDQKKTKVRRQPWSARRFDFFDIGMMDMLQYRLEKTEKIMQGRDVEVTFKGRIIGKRRAVNGEDEFQVTWSPAKIIEDEWIKRPAESHKATFQLAKHVSIKRMTPAQRIALHELVNTMTKSVGSSSQHKSSKNDAKKSRKYSSTCSSSRASIASTST